VCESRSAGHIVNGPAATTTVSPSHKAIGVCPEAQRFRAFFNGRYKKSKTELKESPSDPIKRVSKAKAAETSSSQAYKIIKQQTEPIISFRREAT
jgi:hypothetical protein